jgi:hypothetical protein
MAVLFVSMKTLLLHKQTLGLHIVPYQYTTRALKCQVVSTKRPPLDRAGKKRKAEIFPLCLDTPLFLCYNEFKGEI